MFVALSRRSEHAQVNLRLRAFVQLQTSIKNLLENGAPEVDVAQYMGRAALELIGQSALGHCFDPLTEEGHHPYAKAMKNYMYVPQ